MGDDSGRLSRSEVARRLGITAAHVQNSLDGVHLHPIREGLRVWYTEADLLQALVTWRRQRLVTRLKAREMSYPDRVERGRIARIVFMVLDEGGDFNACVIRSEGDPVWVREFYEAYHSSPEERAAMEEANATAKHIEERTEQAAKRSHRESMARAYARLKATNASAERLRALLLASGASAPPIAPSTVPDAKAKAK